MTNQQEIHDSIDHLFRRYAGQMVSLLTRRYGLENFELVEDSVQDALVAAMKRWPFTGEPENARAWLIETAKNRMIDQLRRAKRNVLADEELESADAVNDSVLSGEIQEDELRMIFACCHPAISHDARVALTLKTVGGFSVNEIARAFLAKPDAVAKLLTRAKTKLRENVSNFEIPSQDQLAERRDSVLKVLYLMFNEGYSASEGEELVRRDLCFEAIRLGSLLAVHLIAGGPKVDAMLALMFFQAARLGTRIDEKGELLLLEDQDRSRWDRKLLAKGLRHFQLSASGSELSEYHLEAEIAAVHALSKDFNSTDWQRILECYNKMQRRKFSPVVELNRIVAIERVNGTAAAQIAFIELAERHNLSRYNLFHITHAHLLALDGDRTAAIRSFDAALSLTSNRSLRRFIERKIGNLRSPISIS